MERFLYKDLYKQEDKHWWHLAKRAAVVELIRRYFPSNTLRINTSVQNDRGGKVQDRKKILDLGCGTGKNMEVLNQFGETYGVDMSKEAVEFCRKRGLKNARVGSSYKTRFNDNYFNLVTLLDVLEHTDDDKTLTEINRILDKNGILIINVPAFQWLWSRWDEVLHHKRRYTKGGLTKVLEKNGFRVVKSSYMFSFLVLPALVLRFFKSRLSKGRYTSDFVHSNNFINLGISFIALLERKVMQNLSIPIGTSLICVAKKVK